MKIQNVALRCPSQRYRLRNGYHQCRSQIFQFPSCPWMQVLVSFSGDRSHCRQCSREYSVEYHVHYRGWSMFDHHLYLHRRSSMFASQNCLGPSKICRFHIQLLDLSYTLGCSRDTTVRTLWAERASGSIEVWNGSPSGNVPELDPLPNCWIPRRLSAMLGLLLLVLAGGIDLDTEWQEGWALQIITPLAFCGMARNWSQVFAVLYHRSSRSLEE